MKGGRRSSGDSNQLYERISRGRELLAGAARLLSSDLALDDLLERAARLIAESFGARAVVFTLEANGNRIEHVFGPGDRDAELSAPLDVGGRAIGRLHLYRGAGLPFEEDELAVLETLALQLGARIDAGRRDRTDPALLELASLDPLTRIANRYGFDEALAREWEHCARSGAQLGLALLDVDFFKQYNDRHGHVSGDACLKSIAAAIAECARRHGGLAARYGGEEFAVIIPRCDRETIVRAAQSICEAVRALSIPHAGSAFENVTVSLGAAVVTPGAGDDPRSLVRTADALLYEAKKSGRNRVAAQARHNLPRFLTPLLGREREIAEIAALLRTARLVSIVGTGGMGKTRVAVQVATKLLDEAGSAWFVDLAPVGDPVLVVPTIANAVGIEMPTASDPATMLATLLKPHRLLLVLDNCEHVIGEASRLAELLTRSCPLVTLLATSREPLGIADEVVFRLGPLDEISAIKLFVEGARHRDRRFDLAEADVPVVAEICRRLDGIALAIELAAARVHVTSPKKLLVELRERLALAATAGRTVRPRHQTMRASIDWSYDLLSDRDGWVFRHLGIFAGWFTIEQAELVCNASADVQMPVREHVLALVDKSLVASSSVGPDRYRLLDSIREHSMERLQETQELIRCSQAHATVFAKLSEDVVNLYGSLPEEAWHARFEPNLDDFRSALDWSLVNDVRLAVTIAGNLCDIWSSGRGAEGHVRSEAVLAAIGENSEPSMLRLWLTVARTAWDARMIERSAKAGERALEIAARVGDPRAQGEVLLILGRTRVLGGLDSKQGLRDLREAIALLRNAGSPGRLARALSIYGYAVSTFDGDVASGRSLQAEALVLAQSAGQPRIATAIEMSLAETEFACGETDGAIVRARSVAETLRAQRWPFELIVSLGNLASYLAMAGRYDRARAAARESLTLARTYELVSRIPPRIQAIALVEAACGDANAAARLLGFVNASYEQRGMARERTEAIVYGSLLELLAARLTPAEIEEELSAGGLLTLDAACELAALMTG